MLMLVGAVAGILAAVALGVWTAVDAVRGEPGYEIERGVRRGVAGAVAGLGAVVVALGAGWAGYVAVVVEAVWLTDDGAGSGPAVDFLRALTRVAQVVVRFALVASVLRVAVEVLSGGAS